MTNPTSTPINPAEMTGLEVMQAMMAGGFPPPAMGRLMGFALTEVRAGEAIFACTPTRAHYNPIGAVHGGLAGVLLDSAMGCAVHSAMQKGQSYTTLEYKVNLVRGMTDKTGPLRIEGKVVHLGRRIATADGRIIDASGKLYAHGTTTCMIFET